MRRHLTLVTVLLAIVGCFSALCRGAEDLSPVLTILAKRAAVQAGSTSPALPAPVTVAPHDDTATVQATTPPAPVVIKSAEHVHAVPKSVAAPAWPKYPSRSVSGSHWVYNGGQITAAHLADPRGHHAAEHFNRAWLNTLSNSQLTALGSDAHEGRVREQYVVRGTANRVPVAKKTSYPPSSSSSCPSGNCPNTTMQRRGLFGRWR